MMDKGASLLAFLKATASIRRKRIRSYGSRDRVLWFAGIPREYSECRSPFLTDGSDDLGGMWLEVRKKRMPDRPPVPELVAEWVRPGDLEQPEKEPELLPEITVSVERQVPDPDAPHDPRTMLVEPVPELRRLADYPEVGEAWVEYLDEKWRPWAQEMRRWREVQSVYEEVDFMRRRLEEAEERYELVLAIGFLQWRDPTGADVARHVLTAPAEVALDAARGLLSVAPAALFDGFRVEFDMLEFQDRPRLNEDSIGEQLAELDIQAWDIALVEPLLREIGNRLRADTQVDVGLQHPERIEERPRLSFAPALVLRERRPTAYEDLIRKFHETATEDGLEGTAAWLRLLREGEPSNGGAGHSIGAGENEVPRPAKADRFLFPLPSNEEQRKIIHRLQFEPCVLVKGPPGTGKSHTIANLICHLLARGDRVLVTAHAPKALAVLRDLLPEDIRDLCVTALGASREDRRLLEESIRGILRRKNEWRGPEAAKRSIQEAEGGLRELEGELARVERDLRAFREAETHSHELPGGYSGTAAQIARRLSMQEPEFGWFPDLSGDDEFPLDAAESAFLMEAHACFTVEARAEIESEIGSAELPGPEEFRALVARLTAAEEAAQRASRSLDEAKREILEPVGTETLGGLREAVRALTDLALRVDRVLGEVSQTVLHDLLASAEARWTRHAADSEALLKDAMRLLEAIGSTQVEFPNGIPEGRLRTDVERRLAHFEAGGRKGFSVLAPRVVRETRYIADACRIDGKKVVRVEQLRCVRDCLELRRKAHVLRDMWGAPLAEVSNLRQVVSRAEELTAELKEQLAFFESDRAKLLATILGSSRTNLASPGERDAWLRAIDALRARRRADDARREFDRVLETLHGLQHGANVHRCLRALADAARTRDVVAWGAAWEERERIRAEKQRLAHYDRLLERFDGSCPDLANLLRTTGGKPVWRDRVRKLREAWSWAAARAWLRRVCDASAYEARVQDYHRLQRKIEKATETLVSRRAWKEFFDRLDESTIQSLNAWTRAVARIGKGTGKHAYRHRRTAQQYLMSCVRRVPAWVMPLHKLWDSVDAEPGLFDTVIVDEASQAGIDSLVLLLLAKRIVVVGDDKQNSPEAVGLREDDIARMARKFLNSFRFRDEFRPDTSLFDHAERAFGSHVTLREHFRCVPEIIVFSNELCYRDAPLIPLRQAPPRRLPPLRSCFVPEGACVGEGQRIANRAEAEAVVQTISELIHEDAYEGKTMGVIALQGRAQAQVIETLLAERLEPKVIEERRLRCGEPATFQGDQRDVIFLSLVIAPNVPYRALTRLPDERRFNVAMSRARDQVWLFHSVKSEDLGPDDLRRRILDFFKNPQKAATDVLFEELDRLEREAEGSRHPGGQPEPYESWFEVDVALELLRRKFKVRPQVEVAGRRIDLVVEGSEARIAVECDGDEWHGPERYEQDMARQRQLERAGWTFVRVRESVFYANRQRAMEAITRACESLGIRPVDFIDESRHEPPRAPVADLDAAAESPMDSLVDGAGVGEGPGNGPEESDVSSQVVEPFTGYSKACGFPDPREASAADVREVLRKIIERDGPLSCASVYRLYVEGCPDLQRVGKNVRQALNRVLGAMLRAGEIVREDELGDGVPEGRVLRIAGTPAVKVRPAGRRDLLEIPPSELSAAMRRLFPRKAQPGGDSQAVFRAVLRNYGFTRLTKSRREYLSKVLELW